MALAGVRSINVDPVNVIDELLGNRKVDGLDGTGRIPVVDFIRQLLGSDLFRLLGTDAKLYETRALMEAEVDFEIPSTAWVFLDPVEANNGIYRLTAGVPKAWTPALPLPFTFAKLLNAGAGTGNGIVVTSAVPFLTEAFGAIALLPITHANPEKDVTLVVNDRDPKPLLTVAGGPIQEGALVPNMVLMVADQGDSYRLLSDYTAAVDSASAAVSRLQAETAKDITLEARDLTLTARDDARAALEAMTVFRPFSSYAEAAAAAVGLADDLILEVFPDETRNNTRTRYKVTAGAPVFMLYMDATDPNGAGFAVPNIRRLGVYFQPLDYEVEADRTTQSNGTTLTPAIRHSAMQAMIASASAAGKEIVIPSSKSSANYKIDAPLYAPRKRPQTVHLEGFLEAVGASEANDGQTVIKAGNFHPALLGAYPAFICDPISAGTDQIVLTNTGSNRADGLAAIAVDDQVLAFSVKYFLGAGSLAERRRPLYCLLANVLDVDALTGVITLDRAVDEVPPGGLLVTNTYQPGILDLRGNPVFTTRGLKIIGGGGMITPGSWQGRSGMLDCRFDFEFVKSKTGLYFNLAGSTHHRIRRMELTEKVSDIAGMSHDSTGTVDRIDFIGEGLNQEVSPGVFQGINMLVVNENTRRYKLKIGALRADKYNVASAVVFTSSRLCEVDIDDLYTPAITGAVVSFNNTADPVTGDQAQSLLHDNVLRLGTNETLAPSRFIYVKNDGGENKRNRVERGRFIGTPTTGYAVTIDGAEDFQLGPVEFTAGALRIENNALRLRTNGGYYPAGVSIASAVQPMISGIRSDSAALLRTVAVEASVNDASSVTTSGDDYLVVMVPPGALDPRDVVEFFIEGTTSGTAGAKTIQIQDGTGVIGTASFLAAENGTFSLTGSITIQSPAAYTATFLGYRKDLVPQHTLVRRTGVDLPTNGRVFTFERWVENAADSIVIRRYGVRPIRRGFDMG